MSSEASKRRGVARPILVTFNRKVARLDFSLPQQSDLFCAPNSGMAPGESDSIIYFVHEKGAA